MDKITIKARLFGLVIILNAVMIGIGVFGMVSTHNIIVHMEADAHKTQEMAHALELAERTEIEFKTQIQEWKNVLIRGNDPKQYDKYASRFDKRSNTVQEQLKTLQEKLKKLGIETNEAKHVAELHQGLKVKYDAALKKFNKNNPEAGKIVDKLVKGVDRPVGKAFDEMAHHLSAEIDNIVAASDAYAAEVETSTRNTDIVIIVVGSAIGIMLGWLLIRSIVNPLNQVIYATQRLAEGDMTTRITVSGKSEITKLQHALAKMSDKLRNVVKQVRDGAENVNLSANEIANGNLDLSSRTEEQAASIEETSSSMEHVTEKVKQNSESAVQAVELANNATSKAEHGLEVAQTAVDAINEIKTSSEKVADIISVIDEIAFQTNLLALNASIEAERAGEQGRGFSVVANEVQKLAQRSADAANEIKALIKNSTEKVQEGTELVTRSSHALEDIVQTSNETNELMRRISQASQEQASALNQVNAAIAQLEEATQQNAALVEETSAASTSMSDQAKSLTNLVQFFKFKKEETYASPDYDTNVEVMSETSAHVAQVNKSLKGADNKARHRATETVGNLALKSESGNGTDWEDF